MLLTPDQRARFLAASDALLEFAAQRAGMVSHLHPLGAADGEPDPNGQLDVAEWIWRDGNLDAIADFVAANPAGLPPEDLQQVGCWSQGVYAQFALLRDGDRSIALVEDQAVELTGISREPFDLVGETPALMAGVLVPFDGLVTYQQVLSSYPVDVGPTMAQNMEDELADHEAAGDVITTAGAFLRALPAIRASQAEGQEDMQAREEYMRTGPSQAFLEGREGMPEGQHRGALADLPWEERERLVNQRLQEDAVRDLMGEVFGEPGPAAFTGLRPPVVTGLHDLLPRLKKDQVKDLGYGAGLSRLSKLRKQELVDATEGALLEDPAGYVGAALADMTPPEVQLVRKVVEAGGQLELALADTPMDKGIRPPSPILPACFAAGEGRLACVVPDELMDALAALDWDEAEVEANERGEKFQSMLQDAFSQVFGPSKASRDEGRGVTLTASEYVESLVALRGVVPLAVAAREYVAYLQEARPDLAEGMTAGEAALDVRDEWDMRADVLNFEIVANGTSAYLLADELAMTNWWDLTGTDPIEEDGGYAAGYPGTSLGESVRSMMAHQAPYKPRPLPEGLAQAEDYMDWALQQPAVRQLARYLDAHVPDGEDDYLYAEDVLAVVVDASHGGINPTDLIQSLGGMGVLGSDNDAADAVLWMVMKVVNSMPNWENNGWSPDEAHELGDQISSRPERRAKKPRPRKKHRRR